MSENRRVLPSISGRRKMPEDFQEGGSHTALLAMVASLDHIFVELDRQGRMIFLSKVAEGFSYDEVVGQDFCTWADPRDHALMRERLERCFAEGIAITYEARATGKNGEPLWYEGYFSPVAHNDRIESVVLLAQDITSKKQEELQRLSEHRLMELFYNLPLIGMTITHPHTRRWIKVNDKLCEMLGYSREEMLAMGWEALTHPEDLALSQHEFERILNGSSEAYQIDKRFVHRSGAIVHTTTDVHCARHSPDGTDYFVALIKDITSRKQQEARIQHMAHHDLLTDLPNRTLLADRLRQTLLQAKRNQTQFAALFIDLDKFKPVNDQHGHAIGDLLLKAVAHRLLGCVRASDTVARMGGDEFVVLLSSVEDSKDAIHVAGKIHDALAVPFKLYNGKDASISSSIGVALYPEHGETEAGLIRSADDAMYVAKAQGRDCVRLFGVP
jgi:diguanylate cyclase (GGDEF)-like protein/PAS domain S-box-containing protein